MVKKFKIVRCKRCGHNNKIIDLEHYFYSESCFNCGYLIQSGKRDGFSWYREVYLQSGHWKTTSRLAREHYGNKCDECGSEERLEVHHLNYDRIRRENLSDLQILCHKCHKKLKPKEEK